MRGALNSAPNACYARRQPQDRSHRTHDGRYIAIRVSIPSPARIAFCVLASKLLLQLIPLCHAAFMARFLIIRDRPILAFHFPLNVQLNTVLAVSLLCKYRILTLVVCLGEDGIQFFELIAIGLWEEEKDERHKGHIEAHEDKVGLPGDGVDHDRRELHHLCLLVSLCCISRINECTDQIVENPYIDPK